MPAVTCRSANFSSPEEITRDLAQMPEFPPEQHAVAFLHCDSQVDHAHVLGLLAGRVKAPIYGGTSFTYALPGEENETSSELMLLAKEGLQHAACLSDVLDEGRAQEQMQEVFSRCKEALGEEPKLLMFYIPMVPGLMADRFATALFGLAGDTPVFGGMTTGDLVETQAAVFFEGQAYTDRAVLLALGGDIRPVFSVGSQLTAMTGYSPTVTESRQNIVCRLDDMTLCEYMRSIGVSPEQRVNGRDALMQYGPLPCRLRNKLEDDDGVPEIRCISYTNVEDGSAAFSSLIPEGAKLGFGLIHKNDVVESSRRCIYELLQRVEENEQDGYRYSAVFSIPCVARYFAAMGGDSLERVLLLDELEPRLAISTYYGFLEIGPTYGKDGEVHNRSHNASIVMCAI